MALANPARERPASAGVAKSDSNFYYIHKSALDVLAHPSDVNLRNLYKGSTESQSTTVLVVYAVQTVCVLQCCVSCSGIRDPVSF